MMKSKNNNIADNLKIIITVGDESGIGPEIILKALFSKEIPNNIDVLIVGSQIKLENTYKNLKSLGVEDIVDPSNYKIFDIKIANSFTLISLDVPTFIGFDSE